MTFVQAADYLTTVETALKGVRADLVRRVDRAEALVELRDAALALTAEKRRQISLADLLEAARDEQERAHLSALLERVGVELDEDEAGPVSEEEEEPTWRS